MPAYALSVAQQNRRLGERFIARSDLECRKWAGPLPGAPPGALGTSGCGPVPKLILGLEMVARSPVVDRTGLAGSYEWSLYLSLQELPLLAQPPQRFVEPPASGPLPVWATRLREQLGLSVETTRAPVTVLVIDAIQQPIENQ